MLEHEMLSGEVQHPEGGRYAATLVLVPGLWAGPLSWRRCASFLGHRGWESRLVDPRALSGGQAPRAGALAAYVAEIGGPAILVAHAGGAWMALEAARTAPVGGIVLVSPLMPGSRGARSVTLGLQSALPLLLGRSVPAPSGYQEDLLLGGLPTPIRDRVRAELAAEPAAAVWDLARGLPASRPPGVPILVVSGERDALLPPPTAEALATALGAEHALVGEVGHWALAGAGWQALVGAVHRWIVRQLGAPLLELYPEAMAAREEDEEP